MLKRDKDIVPWSRGVRECHLCYSGSLELCEFTLPAGGRHMDTTLAHTDIFIGTWPGNSGVGDATTEPEVTGRRHSTHTDSSCYQGFLYSYCFVTLINAQETERNMK
ncbi:hypothetical protein CBL_03188 [Carabus blaptoides fortunei]